MRQIKRLVSEGANLVVCTVTGSPGPDDYMKEIEEILDQCPQKFHIWDFSAANVSGLSSQDLEEIMRSSLSHPKTYITQKVALILPTALSFGLGRMFEVYGEIQEKPWELQPFRSAEEAFQWIGVEDLRTEKSERKGVFF